MEKIKKIRGILDNFEERLLDRESDLKEEVRENIKSEIENMGDDSDLLDFVNEHCGSCGTVHQMDEYEFNRYCDNNCISHWDLLDYCVDKYDTFFGDDGDGELKSSNDLEDFVDIEELIMELIDRDEDLGNSAIRDELDKLNNPDDEIEKEFLDELKTALGIEEEKKEEEVKQDSNEDFEKVVSWIYEHRMLGEDFDNKFPNLANKYKEKEC
jgi:hypothetical protein